MSAQLLHWVIAWLIRPYIAFPVLCGAIALSRWLEPLFHGRAHEILYRRF